MAEAVDQTMSQMTLVDWLDDLTVRFLLNLPPAELSSVPRLCFQVEEAQWFYEDFIRPINPALPSLNLRQFCLTLFQHCPLLRDFNAAQHLAAYEEFIAYKVRVPVRGAILMDDSMEKVLLVRGWKKGASWSFPRGKINKDEPDLDCAIREVYEETGFDLNAAGLVERNRIEDGKVKAIDVTMREQHMKLFVFRGVALDTFFEPRTRKEISKIQWYNVKDLPGFKKQKGVAAHGQGEGQSAKFYMVAPFLGHLKKWIGQQRRKDLADAAKPQHGRNISLSQEGAQATITEDEGEDTEAGRATDNGFDRSDRNADELKRLLSIGGSSPSAHVPAETIQEHKVAQASSLLAMLKGNIVAPAGRSLPQTPLERVDPVAPQQAPRTPQTQQPRHASSAEGRAMFEHSPQTLQQGLQQQQSQRATSMLQQGLPTNLAPSCPDDHRPNSLGFQQAQHSPLAQHAHARNISQHQASQLQSSASPYFHTMQPFPMNDILHTRPQAGYGLHMGQSSLASEQAAPDPSKLPPPKLNAHTTKLLDAFKASPKAHSSSPVGGIQKPPGQHQAALLDLFTKPTALASAQTAVEDHGLPAPASPALTDATEIPHSASRERRPTLNEITRTLPASSKAKSPILPAPQVSQAQNKPSIAQHESNSRKGLGQANSLASGMLQAPLGHDVLVERPKSRGQLFDPAHPKQFVRATSQAKAKANQSPHAPRGPTQQSGTRGRSPKPVVKSPAPSSPKAKAKQPRHENGQGRQQQSVPQFSILQRPGSSRSTAALSPLRQESSSAPAFQPQVLKRGSADDTEQSVMTTAQSSHAGNAVSGDKKDQLLALFGKPVLRHTPPPAQESTPTRLLSPARLKPQIANSIENTGTDMFHGNRAEVVIKTPEPPPSPRLLPEGKVNAQSQRPQTSQQHLLSLFTRPGTSGSGKLNSPGTPISPFTLGTPATSLTLEKLPSGAYDSSAMTPHGSGFRSRLSSMASVGSNGTPSASGAQTPLEAKDLLLGYLNGVVQKEGYKGARKPM